jgi:DNA-directed RNA polymerase subunit beta'
MVDETGAGAGVRAAVQDGLITQGEKYNKVVDAWSKCGDKVAERDDGRDPAPKPERPRAPINSVYMMAHSGARGSPRR